MREKNIPEAFWIGGNELRRIFYSNGCFLSSLMSFFLFRMQKKFTKTFSVSHFSLLASQQAGKGNKGGRKYPLRDVWCEIFFKICFKRAAVFIWMKVSFFTFRFVGNEKLKNLLIMLWIRCKFSFIRFKKHFCSVDLHFAKVIQSFGNSLSRLFDH